MENRQEIAPKYPSQVALIDISNYRDQRGELFVVDPVMNSFPFEVKRVFWITNVPEGMGRGAHAHHTCPEVVVPARGTLDAFIHDGKQERHFHLDKPSQGLYIPPRHWCSFSNFSADCLCLCFTPLPYDAAGYINDYETFRKEVSDGRNSL